jgi:hypothetical protein
VRRTAVAVWVCGCRSTGLEFLDWTTFAGLY